MAESMDDIFIEKEKQELHFRQEPVITPVSPLTRTDHPQNRFLEEEGEQMKSVREKSAADEPLEETCEDPYQRESLMCILCPKRYAVPIVPDYKNPKLLAQFVSPHTGIVYKKHITGLCEHMQQKIEKEVIKAQSYGFMSTKIKEMHYLKDHQLFNPTRPARKNPH